MPSKKEIVPAHSKLGASSMERWASCPGSIGLIDTNRDVLDFSSSSYAEEGTKAHELAAYRLQNNGANPKNIKNYDQETIEAVEVYVDYILGIQKGLKPHKKSAFLVEHRFDLSKVHPGLFGTADSVIYDAETCTLYVSDYKHGMGVPVDPEGNLQLIYYGLGAMLSLNAEVNEVVLSIIQPRYSAASAIKSATIEYADILLFISDLIDAAKATEDPNAELKTGDHCRWCPAKPICPQLREEASIAFKEDLAVDRMNSLDPDELGVLLSKLDQVDAWIKGIREYAYHQAVNGNPPSGFKLVAKQARRQWADEEIATKKFEAALNQAIMRDCLEPATLKSPAKIEKILGKSQKALVDSLTVSISSGNTLVPDTDKRTAIDNKTVAAQMFGDD